ncbi:uncharacterized protein [Aristolochia californica]|uniref:uncharacterized protein n=1 Tax=Aristolochia californica TaxID=171875 RepID=UPI0035D6AFC6
MEVLFVSTSTEKDMASKERDAMERDVKHRVGLQQMELLRIYESLGMEPADAMVVVNTLAKYKDIMVDGKMCIQKRILPPDNSKKPWKSGCITFTSFVIFGSAPLLPFIVLISFTQSESAKFFGACVFSILSCPSRASQGQDGW